MTVPLIIKDLVETFENNKDYYTSSNFNEENTKADFINPFFKALGWDIDNTEGLAPQYKEVVFEDKIRIGGKTKAPDYSFRIGGNKIFFVEAKKPSINIESDKNPAFQIRRYGWSAGLSLCILTDFKELAIYETKSKPDKRHKASIGRVKYYNYKDYLTKWEEIYGILSKEAVLKGHFDNFANNTKGLVKGTSSVDDEFLKEIEDWRLKLARNIALRNKELNIEELNWSVQLIINRILFLRIAEDRGIEKYQQLYNLLNSDNSVYESFIGLCKKADLKYNSGLFHFKGEKDISLPADTLTPSLTIDDGIFREIFKNLYYPNCPYEFSQISIEVLGNVYEQFLGNIIRLTESHHAKVELKPKVKKAGGVYYTPQYIVEYIVKNTIGELLKNKTPNQVSKLRFLDPACGSGSFLLGAYQHLIDWHLDYYTDLERPPQDVYYRGKDGIPRLTINEKKRILLNNIYGVDIDSQAVETTKLSLLLKVLEDQNKDVIEAQQKLFQERALPYLGDNIRCGNSLIGTDILEQTELTLDEIKKTNPFDWQEEFPKVFNEGGFDSVIGNPPYVSWVDMLNRTPFESKKYYDLKYRCRPNHKDAQPNIYMFFLIKSLQLTKNGMISYILPQEWIYQVQEFRDYILENSSQIDIFKFNPEFRVFKNREGVVGTNSLILFIFKNNINKITIFETNELDENENKRLLKGYPYNESIIVHKSKKDRFYNKRWEFFNSLIENLISKDPSEYISFKNEEYFRVCGGFQPNVELSKKYTLTSLENLNQYEKTFIFPCIYNSSSFKRYSLKNEGIYWVVLNNAFENEKNFKNKCPNLFNILSERLKTNKKSWWEFPNVRNLDLILNNQEKLFTPRTSSENSFCYDNQYHVMKGTNSMIFSFKLLPKYVLSILNSSLASYFYQIYGFSYHGGSTKKYEPNHIKNYMIPIRRLEEDKQTPFIELVDKIIKFKVQLSNCKIPTEKKLLEKQIKITDNRINQLVYKLYDLTPEEIQTIEDSGLVN